MRFEVTLNDKKYKAQYTGKTCRIYREQFYGDFLLDIQTGQEKFLRSALERFRSGEDKETENKELNEEVSVPEIDALILYKLYIEVLGTELLEHILWACMASADSRIGLYEQWIDSIDNYPEMLMEAVNCFQIVIGNRSIVDAEAQSTEENTSKKK